MLPEERGWQQAIEECKRLRAQNARYRAALEWYANEPNAIDDDNRAWNALHPQESK